MAGQNVQNAQLSLNHYIESYSWTIPSWGIDVHGVEHPWKALWLHKEIMAEDVAMEISGLF